MQNFKGDLTKICEIFLNITLELPKYSLKSFLFFPCKNLWKLQHYVIYVYFFIKSVVLKWSENSVRFEFFIGIAFQMGQILWDFILQCEILSHSVRYGMYALLVSLEIYMWLFIRSTSPMSIKWACSHGLIRKTVSSFCWPKVPMRKIFSWRNKKT